MRRIVLAAYYIIVILIMAALLALVVPNLRYPSDNWLLEAETPQTLDANSEAYFRIPENWYDG